MIQIIVSSEPNTSEAAHLVHALAKGLLEFETLTADEIRRVIHSEKIVRDTGLRQPAGLR
ncbi:MAG: hypothetical protein KGJ66_12765 [Alphaproteobacteria bacterium]|nr:hypothetical protein [Alphaproteobacteria bacterium]